LLALADKLIIDEALCNAAVDVLLEIHESDEAFKRFREKLSERGT